jgi:aspartyl aminopeptidase
MTEAVSNFLAVDAMTRRLQQAGFTELREGDAWSLRPGDRRYVCKNDSALFAFIVGTDPTSGMRIIAAHSDSPCFRIKPNPEIHTAAMVKLNTEVYGGMIYTTWFDRPLGISGRVLLRSADPLRPEHRLVRIDDCRLIIPSLAIHFNRQVNQGVALSAQKDMLPILGAVEASGVAPTVVSIVAERLGVKPEEILDYDLTLFDVQGPERVGAEGDWVNCGRLDDLAMAWCALSGLLEARPGAHTQVMAIFDNEETGSGTKQGAHSPVLRNVLRRINLAQGGSEEDWLRAVANSFFISADCAHATHPNYVEKMDPVNHPTLGGGPAIKVNANCKYMTDGDSAAVFRALCDDADVPYQIFVNHSDSPGGSTLGNILTSQLDMRGVDMGVALWGMHSCRETVSLTDVDATSKVFSRFYNL